MCSACSDHKQKSADIKKGLVRIEKTEIIGVDDKEYDL